MWPATAPRLLRTRAKCTGSHRIAEHRKSPLVRTRERDIRKICIKEIHRTRWQFFCRLFLLSPRLVCRRGEKENKEIHRNDDKHAKNFFGRRAEDAGSHAYIQAFFSLQPSSFQVFLRLRREAKGSMPRRRRRRRRPFFPSFSAAEQKRSEAGRAGQVGWWGSSGERVREEGLRSLCMGVGRSAGPCLFARVEEEAAG